MDSIEATVSELLNGTAPGHPKAEMALVAAVWSQVLGVQVSSEQAAACMAVGYAIAGKGKKS